MAEFTRCAEPLPTASSKMTEATPIITPSKVSTERSLFAAMPRNADQIISQKLIVQPRPLARWR